MVILITLVSLLASTRRAHAAARPGSSPTSPAASRAAADGAAVRYAAADDAPGDFDESERDLGLGELAGSQTLGHGGAGGAGGGFEPGWVDDVACACDAADFARAVATAPPLPAVVAAAQRAAGLAHDPVPSWRSRSKWSALIPSLSARVGNSQSWREVTDPTVSRAASYDVRASWRLDTLVYDANAPRFTAFDIQRRRERRRIAAAVTHEYFAWLSARATQLGTSDNPDRAATSAAGAARSLMQAQHARAELDALTDGWFSSALAGTVTRNTP